MATVIKRRYPTHMLVDEKQNSNPSRRRILPFGRLLLVRRTTPSGGSPVALVSAVALFFVLAIRYYCSARYHGSGAVGRPAAVNLTVFSSCSRTPSEESDSQPVTTTSIGLHVPVPHCVFFSPVRYFSSGGGVLGGNETQIEEGDTPAFGTLDSLLAAQQKLNLNLRPWAIQVNSYGRRGRNNAAPIPAVVAATTKMGAIEEAPMRDEFASRHGLTSVSALIVPKVGSTTMMDFFRYVLGRPQEGALTLDDVRRGKDENIGEVLRKKKLRPRGGLVGSATATFWDVVVAHRRAKEETRTTNTKLDDDEYTTSASSSDVVFALVRDPVSRFLSSMGQIFSRPTLRRCPECQRILEPCIARADDESNFTVLLRCTINVLLSRSGRPDGGFFDLHVVPQAAYLYGVLAGRDVEVAVFDMDRGGIDLVVGAFGANGTELRRNGREEHILDPNLVRQFGGEDVFLNPSIARDALDGDVIRDICRIYYIDVQMMRYLGFPPASCY